MMATLNQIVTGEFVCHISYIPEDQLRKLKWINLLMAPTSENWTLGILTHQLQKLWVKRCHQSLIVYIFHNPKPYGVSPTVAPSSNHTGDQRPQQVHGYASRESVQCVRMVCYDEGPKQPTTHRAV